MNESRIKRNIVTSLLLQVITVVSAFVLPRLILSTYGSAYNGIVASISQFLSYVTLLRAGVGGVTRAALYKTLAAGDTEKTSAIVRATELFMRKIAVIFSALLILFAAVYPMFVKDTFDWFFSFSMVLILGISTIVQYYFGITNQMLLHADQRLYVSNMWQIAATIINVLLSVLLIKAGLDIRVAKLASAMAFSITPIMLHCYVQNRYSLSRKVAPDNHALAQRWDAFSHQLAAFMHSNTGIIVLTVFTNLLQVSVYTVYNAIANGINMLIATVANAVEASLGKIMAQNDRTRLKESLAVYEMIVHIVTGILFGCTAMLMVSFVMVYTAGVEDVNYNRPFVGYFMCLSYWISAIRLPYQNIIEAAGHFKQTKKYAATEAVLNITLSCVLVTLIGVEGVLLATVTAMAYRTFCYAAYATKHITHQKFSCFLKRTLVSVLSLCAAFLPYILCHVDTLLICNVHSYGDWIVAAVGVFLYVTSVTVLANALFYGNEMRRVLKTLFKRGG